MSPSCNSKRRPKNRGGTLDVRSKTNLLRLFDWLVSFGQHRSKVPRRSAVTAFPSFELAFIVRKTMHLIPHSMVTSSCLYSTLPTAAGNLHLTWFLDSPSTPIDPTDCCPHQCCCHNPMSPWNGVHCLLV